MAQSFGSSQATAKPTENGDVLIPSRRHEKGPSCRRGRDTRAVGRAPRCQEGRVRFDRKKSSDAAMELLRELRSRGATISTVTQARPGAGTINLFEGCAVDDTRSPA